MNALLLLSVFAAAATAVIDPDPPVPWIPKYAGGHPPYFHDRTTIKPKSKTCNVKSGDPSGDDTKAILAAFSDCKENGHVVFANTTYYVGQPMTTTGLKNVDIELLGTLEWSKDVDYWLNHSLPIGFQNQSTAWFLGGDNIHFFGHGHGTLFGNGDVWYDYNNGRSNIQGRPHAISIFNTTNSLIEGLRFIKSQMWTSTVMRSERVELSDIYVNNSCTRSFSGCNVNTDGVDTIYANYITFLRWIVESGDDSMSMKQNSSNIYMANNTFHRGLAYAMGSIGQYNGEVNFIENITALDTYIINSAYAGRVKSWTGRSTGSPPNGGGGGLGWARNISFTNFTLDKVGTPWYITQCTSYNGVQGGCDTSKFHIENMRWGNTTGTSRGNTVASLQCSGAAPCTGVDIFANKLKVKGNGTVPGSYLCSNVNAPKGFTCTGKAPNTSG